MGNDEIKVYETGFHIVDKLKIDEANKMFEKILSFIKDNKGEVISKEDPQEMDLKYTIKSVVRGDKGSYDRYDSTYFASIKFSALPNVAKSLEEYLKEEVNILRSIVWKTTNSNTRVSDIFGNKKDKEKKEVEKNVNLDSPESMSVEGVNE